MRFHHVVFGFSAIGLLLLPLPATAGSAGANDQGTRLSVTVSQVSESCVYPYTSRTYNFEWEAKSTGSADSALVTATIDGVSMSLPGIASGMGEGGWTNVNRFKYAGGEIPSATFASGPEDRVISVCLQQSTDVSPSTGRMPKYTCGSFTVHGVTCEDPCKQANPQLDIIGVEPLSCSSVKVVISDVRVGEVDGTAGTIAVEGPDMLRTLCFANVANQQQDATQVTTTTVGDPPTCTNQDVTTKAFAFDATVNRASTGNCTYEGDLPNDGLISGDYTFTAGVASAVKLLPSDPVNDLQDVNTTTTGAFDRTINPYDPLPGQVFTFPRTLTGCQQTVDDSPLVAQYTVELQRQALETGTRTGSDLDPLAGSSTTTTLSSDNIVWGQ